MHHGGRGCGASGGFLLCKETKGNENVRLLSFGVPLAQREIQPQNTLEDAADAAIPLCLIKQIKGLKQHYLSSNNAVNINNLISI